MTVGHQWTYSNVHDAAAGSIVEQTETTITTQSYRHDNNGNQIRLIYRGFTLFDTSALGPGTTIASSTYSLYGIGKGVLNFDDGNDFVTVVQTNPASNTSLALADYDQAGDALYYPSEGASRIDISSGITTSGYNDFPLNATGTAWVSKTGITKLGVREGHDVLGIDFDLNNTARNVYAQFASADTSGTTQDPKLVVTGDQEPGGGGGPEVPLDASGIVQVIEYTYDPVGNITMIVDRSATDNAATTTYTYDDLNRLLTASTTESATGIDYLKTYSYDWLGNILGGDLGSYAYQGTTTGSYANPHAFTSIGGVATSTYDNAGNMLTYKQGSTATSTYTWDYRNRISKSAVLGTTTTYAYDLNNERVFSSTSTGGFLYPWPSYSVSTSTGTTSAATKHIYANGELIATIKGSNATATPYYVHTDHLGGSNVLSNSVATIEQEFSYYPFGGMRVSKKLGEFSESKRYTGHEYDAGTRLNYMKARYQDPAVGRFLSQDAVFLNLNSNSKILTDPQQLNSYSYARNNPLKLVDPDGQNPLLFAAVGLGAIAAEIALLAFAPTLTQQLLDPNTFEARTLQEPGRGPGFMQPRFDSDPPPGENPNAPKWQKAALNAIITLTIGTITWYCADHAGDCEKKVHDQFAAKDNTTSKGSQSVTIGGGNSSKHYISSGTSYLPSFQSYISNNVYSSSVETRYNAVQSYNTSSGNTSNESKLWVTPGGAVITWGGDVIVPASSSKN